LAAAAVVSCAKPKPQVTVIPDTPADRPVARPVAPTNWHVDRSTFDSAAAPCNDFYQYVCGGFDNLGHIPPEQASADWSRDQARVANDSAIQLLLTGTDGNDPEVDRIRTFYASCMATGDAADKPGHATLTRWMKRIDRIQRPADVGAAIRELHAAGVNALFQFSGQPDSTNQSQHRGEIDAGTSGANLRLYGDKTAGADDRREAYRGHIRRMFEGAGQSPVRALSDARVVYGLEAELAAATPKDFDPVTREHPMTLAALRKLAPRIDWAAYLKMVGYPVQRAVNVVTPAHVKAVDGVLAKQPIAAVRAYLRWEFLQSLGRALPAKLADERYRYLAPAGATRGPRASECQLETVKALGVELSRQFATRFIGPEPRDRARAVAESVRSEMVAAVTAVSWLSPAGRAFASDKLEKLALKIGFPEVWPATGSEPLRPDSYLDNALATRAYEQHRTWQRALAPRERESWENTVHPNDAPGMAAARLTIPNGFPDPFSNSIVIMAATLRAPLFDAAAPPEVRYGSFGTTIAHELTHVLEAHMFTSEGEFHESWSAEDIKALDDRHACMVEQGNQFVAIDTTHQNGERTVDENIADLGGVAHAYAAMAQELGPRMSETGADGLTPAKRFFIAYGQHYCAAMRPEYAREYLRNDGHGPPRFRVNAPLWNLPAFGEAFSCPKDAAMVRSAPSRCVVW
jgi:endothelin-converting enzyme/putative endopeptidase